MFVHNGYQLNLDQYPPLKCEEGCEFQMEDQFWDFSKSSDCGGLVIGSKHGFSGRYLILRK